MGSGFYLLSIGIGCIFASLASVFFGFTGQIITMIVVSMATFFLSRQIFYRRRERDVAEFGVDKMIGQSGIVLEEVTEHSGYVKIGGERWPARILQGSEKIDPGSNIQIIDIDGNKLIVIKA
jgi:membrane protein implicated in regulation of membrane protease activity